MASIGSVTIGSKTIDLHGFTGEVISSSRSSETQESYQGNQLTRSRTWNYNKFTVRAPDGTTRGTEVDTRQATVTEGEQVTLVWGVVGKKESDYLAVYKHASGSLGVVWDTRNELAGPAIIRSQFFLTCMFALCGLGFLLTGMGGTAVVIVGLRRLDARIQTGFCQG